MDPQELWTIISVFVALTVSFIGLIVGLYRHFDSKIDGLRKEFDERLVRTRQELKQEISRDIGGLALVFHKFFEALKDKGMFTPDDVFRVFGNEYLQRYSGKLSNPSYHEERRKAELLRKAQSRTITYEEAMELKRLLEKQKHKHESSGDIVGAILAFILIMALLWLISEIFGEKKK